MPVAAHPE
jgi:hypothetical protein